MLQNGEESITLVEDATLYYDSTNIDKDPVFTGIGTNPYQIDYGSPCIDRGTLDLPPFLKIPEYDLAGNPRVVGNSIDMGCYEWNPSVGIGEHHLVDPVSMNIYCSANPACNKIRFMFDNSENSSNLKLVITNIAGYKVATVSKQTNNNTFEIDVSSWTKGTYIANIFSNRDIISSSCQFIVN